MYPAGLAPVGDPDRLTDRVAEVLRDAPPVSSEQPYPLQRMLDQTLALYQGVSQAPR